MEHFPPGRPAFQPSLHELKVEFHPQFFSPTRVAEAEECALQNSPFAPYGAEVDRFRARMDQYQAQVEPRSQHCSAAQMAEAEEQARRAELEALQQAQLEAHVQLELRSLLATPEEIDAQLLAMQEVASRSALELHSPEWREGLLPESRPQEALRSLEQQAGARVDWPAFARWLSEQFPLGG